MRRLILIALEINAISFNDRIRDAVLGGSPFGHPLQQGFVTGLGLQVTTFLLLVPFFSVDLVVYNLMFKQES